MTPYEYLLEKGIKKVHQPWKRYNLSIEELVAFLNEYSTWKNMSLLETYNELSKENKDQLRLNFSDEVFKQSSQFKK
jgi:hypothetical protein